ncbi:MAG: BrnT family toxin [Campylobacterota bacterium]|nr:BrnT family toxin [Campylobacterota bacterium]
MKYFNWNDEKNEKLKLERGLSFEDVEIAISDEKLLDLVNHPNQLKYPGQQIFIVEIAGYAHLVPFVETEEEIFLKSVIPSRKMTKRYLGGKDGK